MINGNKNNKLYDEGHMNKPENSSHRIRSSEKVLADIRTDGDIYALLC